MFLYANFEGRIGRPDNGEGIDILYKNNNVNALIQNQLL